jgi:ABC-2 type transport system permease protein
LDFVMILILFSHTDALGGLGPSEVFFIYGSSAVALGIADMLAGSLEGVGQRIRDGSLDSMLVRPIPVLAQVAADQFALRRIGRITQALVVLVISIVVVPVEWTPAKAVLVVLMVLAGSGIFCAVFLLGGCFQFVAGDAAEVSNAFTYGGDALAQLPWTIYPAKLLQAVVFVIPLAFINWVPAAWILGRPLPLDMPPFMAWSPPLVAAAFLGIAGLLWRVALRSYRSTGS